MSSRALGVAVALAALPVAANHLHHVPMRTGSAPIRVDDVIRSSGTAPTCANGQQQIPCAIDLKYFGGHVVSNPKVYAVFWGNAVDSTTQANIGGFLRMLTNSPWMDWFAEYSTDIDSMVGSHQGQPGTNQIIGRGVLAATITITPAKCAAPTSLCALTNADIVAELRAQIAAGRLPQPDWNTVFMLYFPLHVSITDDDGSKSCQQFCGYHNTFTVATQSVYYGVIPDLGPGSGCEFGCGLGSTFENVCSASSHELGEAMTDAETGLVPTVDFPMGWYDVEPQSQGEIGDMCNQSDDTMDASGPGCTPGTSGCYTVQQMFSRATWLAGNGNPNTPACISASAEADDYSIALSPNAATIVPGAQTTAIAIETASSGHPGTLALSVTAVPSGVHATIDHASISAGSPANLALSVDAGASVHDGLVVVQAKGAKVHTAAILVNASSGTGTGDDFTLSIAPASLALVAGGAPQSFTVSTTRVSGSTTQSITMSVSGLPSGVSASFGGAATTTVTAGQAAVLTVAPGPSAVPSTQFTVKGTSAAVPAGHTVTASVSVTASAVQPPDVAITSPANGAHLRGTVTLSVTGSVDPNAHGFASVEVALDGVVFATASSAPASGPWDTTKVSDGPHTLLARATDGLGNTGVSQPVNVTIANGGSGGTDDFDLSLSSQTVTLQPGAKSTLSIATTAVGSPGAIQLSISGLPQGITGTFSPNPVPAGASSTLTLSVDPSASGKGTLTVTGTASGTTHSATAAYSVSAGSTDPATGGTPSSSHTQGCSSAPGASGLFLLVAASLLRPRRRRVLATAGHRDRRI